MTESHEIRALPAGESVLWYRIERVLGQGGFGITYLATDTNLDTRVAIKEYLPVSFAVRAADRTVTPASTAQAEHFRWGLDRFVEEGRVLARFDHPGVVRVHSVFEHNGTAYLVMRYEDGEALGSMLQREGRLSQARLSRILFDVIDGLAVVHAAGFIHRDIKPDNIFLREDGSAVLIDFGAARQSLGEHSHALTAIVSPGYAPFEQYFSDGSQQGPWTDIYALAATAYRAASGKSPMPAVDRSKAVLEGAPDSLVKLDSLVENGYSTGFLMAVNQALRFRPGERPQDLKSWREALSADGGAESEPAPNGILSEALTVQVGPPDAVSGLESRSRPEPGGQTRPVARLLALFAIGLVLVGLVALFLAQGDTGETASPPTATLANDDDQTGHPEPIHTEDVIDPGDSIEPPAERADTSGEATDTTQAYGAAVGAPSVAPESLSSATPRPASSDSGPALVAAPDADAAATPVDAPATDAPASSRVQASTARDHLRAAGAAAKAGDIEGARRELKAAARLQPDNPAIQRAYRQLEASGNVRRMLERIGDRATRLRDPAARTLYQDAMRAVDTHDYLTAQSKLRELAQRARKLER